MVEGVGLQNGASASGDSLAAIVRIGAGGVDGPTQLVWVVVGGNGVAEELPQLWEVVGDDGGPAGEHVEDAIRDEPPFAHRRPVVHEHDGRGAVDDGQLLVRHVGPLDQRGVDELLPSGAVDRGSQPDGDGVEHDRASDVPRLGHDHHGVRVSGRGGTGRNR